MAVTELYNGSVALSFDGRKHRYTVGGNVVANVTSVTGMIDKPALVGWAAKMTAEYVREKWVPGKGYTAGQINYIVDQSKRARYMKSKVALDIGSKAHDWAEEYINAAIFGLDAPGLPTQPQVLNAVKSFVGWVESNDVKFYFSERKVYSKEHNYCGTVDLLAEVNGWLATIDLKTSTGIYPEYYLQVIAYARAIEEELGLKSETIGVLRIPKDGEPVEYGTAKNSDDLFDAFLAALKLWEWKNAELLNT